MSTKPKFATIDEYIAAAVPKARPVLRKLRSIAQRTVPGATECISYQMPSFRHGKIFLHFAAFQHHIGIYPPLTGDSELIRELLPYRGEKGNLKFPLAEPLPYELIERLVPALAAEYAGGS
jgi:uncharacterized protein YdhG (YjbR/CyaY superfamily)